MNNYPVNYRITFFIKGDNFDIEKGYEAYASMLSERYQCEGQKEFFPVIFPNAILRQMVATFNNFDKGIMVKFQAGRIDINLQKTATKDLVTLKESIEELLDIYTQILNIHKDLIVTRVACCSTYLFDGNEDELQERYYKIVRDFEEESPIEWTIQRISRISEYKDCFPSPITNNTIIKRTTVRGRFEEKAKNRILVEIDLNSFPQDVSFDADTTTRFFSEMPNKEERVYKALQNTLQ